MLITSVKNPNVVLWAKLKKSKYQKEEQKFIIEEKLIIEEAKKAGLSMTVIALMAVVLKQIILLVIMS